MVTNRNLFAVHFTSIFFTHNWKCCFTIISAFYGRILEVISVNFSSLVNVLYLEVRLVSYLERKTKKQLRSMKSKNYKN